MKEKEAENVMKLPKKNTNMLVAPVQKVEEDVVMKIPTES